MTKTVRNRVRNRKREREDDFIVISVISLSKLV